MFPDQTETPRLRIETTSGPAGMLVHCAGEIDIGNVENLEHALAELLRFEPGSVAVDLRDVTYFDSCTVQVLEAACRQMARCRRPLRVRATPFGERLLRLLRMDQLLEAAGEGTPEELAWDAGAVVLKGRRYAGELARRRRGDGHRPHIRVGSG